MKLARRFLFTLVLLSCSNSFAQSPSLLSDINKVEAYEGLLLGTFVNGKYFFLFGTPETGLELWVSDGTPGGTALLKDIEPGPAPSLPYDFTPADGPDAGTTPDFFYFSANTSAHGRELWKSDGTAAGNVMVKDINPGPAGSDPQHLSGPENNNTVVFSAFNPATGRELWYSSGTAGSTDILVDARPGSVGSEPRDVAFFPSNVIVWSADNGVNGREPWCVVPLSFGPAMLADVNPGIASSEPREFIINEGLTPPASTRILFSAKTDTQGREIFQSNITTTGLLKDIAPGASSSDTLGLTNITPSMTLFFARSPGGPAVELWKTNGTAAGTLLVNPLTNVFAHPALLETFGGASLVKGLARPIAVAGGRAFFTAGSYDPADPGGFLGVLQGELWTSDGTSVGTRQVADTFPGYGGTLSLNLQTIGSSVITPLNNGTSGVELWRSNGTPETTNLIADLNPGVANFMGGTSAFGFGFGSVGAFVSGPSGVLALGIVGNQSKIFFTDGTSGNTREVITASRPNTSLSSNPFFWGTVANKVFFQADNGALGTEPFITDGTSAGTQLLKDLSPLSPSGGINSFRAFVDGSRALFSAFTNEAGQELWITDGTPAGTQLLVDLIPGVQSSAPSIISAELNGLIFFTANTPSVGHELWVTDGTVAGTRLVKDINPGVDGSGVWDAVGVLGNKIIFSATDAANGTELWVSDGTSAGTQILANLSPGATGSGIGEVVAVGNIAYFKASPNGVNAELWKTDGTTAGTVLVKDIRPGVNGSNPDTLRAGESLLYFVANDGVTGRELWVSDGTEAGTKLLADSNPGAADSSIDRIVTTGNTAYFDPTTPATGEELWFSNGTPAGTALLKDIRPGANSSFVENLFSFPGTNLVFFTADDGTNGTELWRSDGTAAGTILVDNLGTGSKGSAPGELFASNGVLYFYADSSNIGVEPWTLLVDACPADTSKLAPGICGCGQVDDPTDSDGDGVPNCADPCPSDPLKISSGVCGCGVSDVDSDADGTPNCIDSCSLDPGKVSAGSCGCGVPDADLNANAILDCFIALDLKAQIKSLQRRLSQLKPAKNKKQARALKQRAKEARSALTALLTFAQSNTTKISLSGKSNLKKSSTQVRRDVLAALKLKGSLPQDVRKANRTLGNFAKSIR